MTGAPYRLRAETENELKIFAAVSVGKRTCLDDIPNECPDAGIR
jgi:hypothetical protein